MTVYSIFGIIGGVAAVLTVLRYFLARPSNLFIAFLQNFVGALFIFSGFVKAVDPLGTGYKMQEYFEAFGAEGFPEFWEWVGQFSTLSAIVMIALELFIGLALLIGWKPRFTTTIIWWLTLFFTLLTGYTYLSGYTLSKGFLLCSILLMLLFALIPLLRTSTKRTRLTVISLAALAILLLLTRFTGWFFTTPFQETGMKVTDCGCFGDFMKLKPWETFYKDVVLDVMILFLVLGVKHVRPLFGNFLRNGLAGLVALFALFFCLYNTYMNLPLIDFRPYKIGNNINELRQEKVPAKIEMRFTYKNKNTGEVKEFTMSDLGSLDYDTWEFVERKDKVLDPGIPAVINNLRIENDEGQDITDDLLADENYSMMVVAHNLAETHTDAYRQLNEIAKGCDKIGVDFYAVVLNDGHVNDFRHQYGTAYPFYSADETPLKTIVRSNPGLVLLKNGVVIAKWHYRHLPTFEQLNQKYFKK